MQVTLLLCSQLAGIARSVVLCWTWQIIAGSSNDPNISVSSFLVYPQILQSDQLCHLHLYHLQCVPVQYSWKFSSVSVPNGGTIQGTFPDCWWSDTDRDGIDQKLEEKQSEEYFEICVYPAKRNKC